MGTSTAAAPAATAAALSGRTAAAIGAAAVGITTLALYRTHRAAKERARAEAEAAAEAERARRAQDSAPASFAEAVERFFGGSLRADDCVLRLTAALREQGFTRDSTLTTLSLPRDPLMLPLRELLQKQWGECLCLSTLSGLPLLGVTGLRAAISGAGQGGQRPRTAIIACAHLAIAADGTVGECDVLGQRKDDAPAHACSGLLAFRHELASGQVDVQPDPADLEYWLLKQALLPRVTFGTTVPSLEELVQLAAGAIADEVEQLVNAVLLPPDGSADSSALAEAGDVAVFVGVALHGPQHPRNELILPIQFYSAVDGVVADLLPTLRPEGGAGEESGSRQSV